MKGRLLAAAVAALVTAMPVSAAAETFFFRTSPFSGLNERPTPNASPGTGFATLVWDTDAHTATYDAVFAGLLGTTVAAHTHSPRPTDGPTAEAFAVATTTPSYPGFPLGVTFGSWHRVVDLTQAASYNASFITAFGGLPQAEAGLLAGLQSGRAYFNVHSSVFTGGEIRGNWAQVAGIPEPGAWALMIGGFAAVGAALRRRRAAPIRC